MGNTHNSTRRNNNQVAEAKRNRSKASQFRKHQIDEFQTQLETNTIQNIKNTVDTNDCIAIMEQMTQTKKIIDQSKVQLDREGLALTKADLIAVIIALNPDYTNKINELSSYTLCDLNCIIRVCIYDPNRYLNDVVTNKKISTDSLVINSTQSLKKQQVKSKIFMLL